MLQIIQDNPLVVCIVAALVVMFFWNRGGSTSSLAAIKQLPEIIPTAKARTPVEALEALDTLAVAMRDRKWPEKEVETIVSAIAQKLYTSPPENS